LVPRYTFTLRMIDESATLDDDALATAIAHLGPLGKRRADDDLWVGECDAANVTDARRDIETKLAHLPRYVPKLTLVDLG
jgi:hypothetical protein